MASNIDPTCAGQLTTRGLNVQKSEVQEQFQAAKTEIEALQEDPAYLEVTGNKTLVAADWGNATSLWIHWSQNAVTFEEVITLPDPATVSAGTRLFVSIKSASTTRCALKDDLGNWMWAGLGSGDPDLGASLASDFCIVVRTDSSKWEMQFGRVESYVLRLGSTNEVTNWSDATAKVKAAFNKFSATTVTLYLMEDMTGVNGTLSGLSQLPVLVGGQTLNIEGFDATYKLTVPFSAPAGSFSVSSNGSGKIRFNQIDFDFSTASADPDVAITLDGFAHVDFNNISVTTAAGVPNNTIVKASHCARIDFSGGNTWALTTDGVTPVLHFNYCPMVTVRNTLNINRSGAADAGYGIHLYNSGLVFVDNPTVTVSDFTIGILMEHNSTLIRESGTITISSNTTGITAKYAVIAFVNGVTFSGNTADSSPALNTVANANSLVQSTAV